MQISTTSLILSASAFFILGLMLTSASYRSRKKERLQWGALALLFFGISGFMASYYKDSIAHDSILKETEFISKLRNPELDYTKSTLKNAWSGHTRLDYGEKPYLILRALKEDGGEWVMECVRLCNVRKALRNNGYLSEEFMKEIDVVVILHDSPLDIRYYGSRSEPIKGIRYKTNIHFYNITTGIFFDFNEMHATSLPASTLGDPSKMVPEEDVLAGVEIRMKKRHGMLEVE